MLIIALVLYRGKFSLFKKKISLFFMDKKYILKEFCKIENKI